MTELEKFMQAEQQKRERLANAKQNEEERQAAVMQAIQAYNQRFDGLVNSLRELYPKIKPLADRACYIHRGLLSVFERYLVYCEKRAESVSFNSESCFSVCDTATQRMYDALRTLFAGDPAKYAWAALIFAESYNTIIDLMVSIDSLRESALQNERSRIIAENTPLESDETISYDLKKLLAENEQTQNELMLGAAIAPAEDFPNSISIPFGFSTVAVDNGTERYDIISDTLSWSFDKYANIQLDYEDACESNAVHTAENISIKFLEKYPLSATQLLVCNPTRNDDVIEFYGALNNREHTGSLFYLEDRTFACKMDQRDIFSAIESLESMLTARLPQFGSGGNILTYNQTHGDTACRLVLLVLFDYNKNSRAYSQVSSKIEYLAKSGAKGGIHLVFLSNRDKTEMRSLYGQTEDLFDPADLANTLHAMIHADKGQALCRVGNADYSTMLRGESYYFNGIVDSIEATVKKMTSSLSLSDLMPEHQDTEDFSKVISIPIGRSVSGTTYLNLDSDGKGVHVAVAGKTGTGKSSILQAIIIGGAYIYSPDQLQFWILDFKDGNGLNQFSELKHVKLLSLRNRATDARELVKYIQSEQTRRAALITESGTNSITGYNKKMLQLGKPTMPRLLIVIDEYSAIRNFKNSRECISVIDNVAKQGRSQGIVLIVSAQKLNKDDGEAVVQSGHKFEYDNESIGHLINDGVCYASDNDKQYLRSAIKGCCLYNNGSIHQVRIGYAGDDDAQRKTIREINDKWSTYPTEPPIITGDYQRRFFKAEESFMSPDETTELYNNASKDKCVCVPLGISTLSGEYRYFIGKNSPYLLLMGDSQRAACIEYSIMRQFLVFCKMNDNVFYLDLNKNIDQNDTVMSKKAKLRMGGHYYKCQNNADVQNKLMKLIALYRERRLMTDYQLREAEPVEMMIHNAENLIAALRDKEAAVPSGGIVRRQQPEANKYIQLEKENELGQDKSDFLNRAVSSFDDSYKREDINYEKEFKLMLADGKNYRIYFTLFFEDQGGVESFTSQFLSQINSPDSLVVIDPSNNRDSLSIKQVSDWFSRSGRVNSAEGGNLKEAYGTDPVPASEFNNAFMINAMMLDKFIPYEYQ